MPDPRIRRAQERDLSSIVTLIHELAAYEREPDSCQITEEQLKEALFSENPALFCHVAEVDGNVVGCALWFLNFSTWRGTHGMYIEDLFVRPEHRGSGLGKALLTTLAEECRQRGYSRLDWLVLDWNSSAVGFYKSLGAVPLNGWTVFRLTDDALTVLGNQSPLT